MAATRLQSGVSRPAPVIITVDGSEVEAYPGESVAAALLAAGFRSFRSGAASDPRGPVCNMGVCFECVVTVDGMTNVRSCMTPIRPGMKVERSGRGGES